MVSGRACVGEVLSFFSGLSGLCCKEGVPRVWVRGGGCECLVKQFSWPQRNICSGCRVPLHRGVLSIMGEAKLMTVRTQGILCCLLLLRYFGSAN